ncbi:hypothetical protein FISHEDRAFT_73177 [Fistulina hepatica ATCC 64428]|uniref:DUF6534 domain-containing protein n=1 Tax=Fistulina hepatica ATCC 64428 TaxID=1128425 RepID=A0A0D7AB45_9AGAR|nr:hypothetical protein FISHEDRAFT_74940 [Fistulina hepatica ATCC 64428]KIY48913.1 hypothetical protein FISHEDRAFT_73177 [Fistulina hepatica ATCC 64428]
MATIFSFTLLEGLPTAVTTLACEILTKTSPGTFIYSIFSATLGRWYTNCLLVSLNSRDYIRDMGHMPPTVDSIPLTTSNRFSSGERRRQHNETFQINIETRTDTTYNHSDSYIQAPAVAFTSEGKTAKDIHGKSGPDINF